MVPWLTTCQGGLMKAVRCASGRTSVRPGASWKPGRKLSPSRSTFGPLDTTYVSTPGSQTVRRPAPERKSSWAFQSPRFVASPEMFR